MRTIEILNAEWSELEKRRDAVKVFAAKTFDKAQIISDAKKAYIRAASTGDSAAFFALAEKLAAFESGASIATGVAVDIHAALRRLHDEYGWSGFLEQAPRAVKDFQVHGN